MHRTGAVVAKWLGALLLLMAPYVLVAGYWQPRGVQFLNEVVCDPGQHLHDRGPRQPGQERPPLQLTCRTENGSLYDATGRMFGVAGAFLVAGFAVMVLGRRLDATATRLHGPSRIHS